MINSLKWESVHSTGFGACIFFKCEVINKEYSYTIDVSPELDEYRLHVINKDGEYRVLGRYVNFEIASHVANYHYRETVSRN